MTSLRTMLGFVIRSAIGYLKYLLISPVILLYGWFVLLLISIVATALSLPPPINVMDLSVACDNAGCDPLTTLWNSRIVSWVPILALVLGLLEQVLPRRRPLGWKKLLLGAVGFSTAFFVIVLLAFARNGMNLGQGAFLILAGIVWLVVEALTIYGVCVAHLLNRLIANFEKRFSKV